MNAFVLGIDHTTQHQDSEGRLEAIIRTLCDEHKVTVIAEEWNTGDFKDYATVGRRIAEELSIAWLNVEIGDKAKKRLGILYDLKRRIYAFDSIKMEFVREIDDWVYFPRADCLREHRWLRKIARHKRNSSVLVLCGDIHVKPFASKLREAGFNVATSSLCQHQWYRDWQHSKCSQVEAELVDERY